MDYLIIFLLNLKELAYITMLMMPEILKTFLFSFDTIIYFCVLIFVSVLSFIINLKYNIKIDDEIWHLKINNILFIYQVMNV